MPAIAAIATGLLIVASFAVGVRLVGLHRRTGGTPELLLGGMLLLTVGVGYPLMIAATQTTSAAGVPCAVVGICATAVGFTLLFVFTTRVFRPQAGWARALTALGVLAMGARALQMSHEVVTLGALDISDPSLTEIVFQLAPMNVAYTWTAWESLRYYGLMRRRVQLGLADAAVCNRFLLWGLMALAADTGILVSGVASAMHLSPLANPAILLLSSVTGLAQVVLLVLTFLPPKSYASWIRARAARGGA